MYTLLKTRVCNLAVDVEKSVCLVNKSYLLNALTWFLICKRDNV